MNTAVINIKTQPEIKARVQKIAEELGLSLSAFVNGLLKQLVRTKSVTFNRRDETPNEYLRSVIHQAERNLKQGNHSPVFKTGEESVKWLEKQGI